MPDNKMKNFRFTDEDTAKVEEIRERYHLRSFTDALMFIIHNFPNDNSWATCPAEPCEVVQAQSI